MDEEIINRIRENWLKASKDFDFEIISPFSFEYKGETFTELAFLPKFGSENGMVISIVSFDNIHMEPQKDYLVKWSKKNKIFSSLINYKAYYEYDKEKFKEALDDWYIF